MWNVKVLMLTALKNERKSDQQKPMLEKPETQDVECESTNGYSTTKNERKSNQTKNLCCKCTDASWTSLR